MFLSLAEMFLPPERTTVAEAAEKYVVINQPGAYSGPYMNAQAPYMIEPANNMVAREFDSVIFCGPAQCGKTQSLILNFLAYNVVIDPMDMIIYSPTMTGARDFSMRRVDRLHRFSKEVGSRLLQSRDADNKYDKTYKSGVMVSLGWPTVSQFAGRPVGRILLTDYDRMPDDIEGDGSPFDLASKRTTTFGSFAMTMAESSPSRPLEKPKWIATSAHEAPPTTGILALYNRGDRRRFYWPCKHCSVWFEGNFRHIQWDTHDRKNNRKLSSLECGRTARLICPHCTGAHGYDDRQHMLVMGVWLRDGERIEGNEIKGRGTESRIASYWLNGVAASFISWAKLVSNFVDAENDYQKTGSQEALKKFYNNDLAEPYVQKTVLLERLPEVLKARSEKLPEQQVPEGVRFLVATVDIQASSFVVQVFGVAPGSPFDLVVVDRFIIYKSKRVDDDGDAEWVKPGTYAEDWELITEQVIKKTYALSDGSGRRMMVKVVGCDSGGRAGVTTNAYNYWRSLRALGLSSRLFLLKGEGVANKPRVTIDYPDASRKDRNAGARGDVPVVFLNSNLLKDDLLGRLDCTTPGKGMFRFPDWMPDNFYTEMCAETRKPEGWDKPGRTRNEAWDLSYYAIGLCVSPFVQVEKIVWENPPGFADVWDKNDLVFAGQTERFALDKKPSYDFAALAQSLA